MITQRKTYTSCADLPLYNFIKIAVTGDLTWIYAEQKKPWHRHGDEKGIWQDIFAEYNELSGNRNSAHVYVLVRLITSLNNKLRIVHSAVDVLSRQYNKSLCDMLIKMGFRFSFSPETLVQDLQFTLTNAKSMFIKREEAEKEYAEMNKDSKRASEKDYNALIAQLSKYMQFKIDPKTTSVLDFISYIEAFNQEHKPKQNGR
ncbi:MAG: hypothetical protein EOP48_25150 [Sphingobacteriales bacterium]|nr:MAG: hypothetical protein EOP48_25150 [Sphingobacteriales bacterium]